MGAQSGFQMFCLSAFCHDGSAFSTFCSISCSNPYPLTAQITTHERPLARFISITPVLLICNHHQSLAQASLAAYFQLMFASGSRYNKNKWINYHIFLPSQIGGTEETVSRRLRKLKHHVGGRGNFYPSDQPGLRNRMDYMQAHTISRLLGFDSCRRTIVQYQ